MRGMIEKKLAFLIPEQKFGRWKLIARVSLITLFFAAVILALVNFDLPEIRAIIEQNRNLAFIIGLLVIFLSAITFIPTIPLTIIISALIEPFTATIITTLGTTLSALVHYQMGKQIGDVLNFEEKKAWLPFKLGKLPLSSPFILVIGRALPGGPIGLSFVCGAYRVPHFLYLWTTLFTNFIGSAFIAYGFDQLIKL